MKKTEEREKTGSCVCVETTDFFQYKSTIAINIYIYIARYYSFFRFVIFSFWRACALDDQRDGCATRNW